MGYVSLVVGYVFQNNAVHEASRDRPWRVSNGHGMLIVEYLSERFDKEHMYTVLIET